MMEKALNDMNRVEEYLIIWQELWGETRHKQPLYDRIDALWKSMTFEERVKVNRILKENRK